MKNVLVTGGAGFIGSNFVRLLNETAPGVDVVVYDKMTYAASAENLAGLRFLFHQADVCDTADVRKTIDSFSIDTVVHFAAETHVDRSITGPAPFIQSNIVGTASLLDAIHASNMRPRLHHISTDEVYGDMWPSGIATEKSPYAPSSPYAASKAASDHLVRAYVRTYGIAATISHSTNNYGPRQNVEKLIPLAIRRMLCGEPVPVYGDGLQERDWIHVDDHNTAILAILDKGIQGETYNIGYGYPHSNLRVLQTLKSLTSSTSELKRVTDRAGHDRRYALDTTKMFGLGWSPRIHTIAGLAATVEWYRSHA